MKTTIIFTLAFVAVLTILGCLNASDIKDCVARGHSEATCEHSINR